MKTMPLPVIFLSVLHIFNLLSVASARITQYIICSDDQEFPIKVAIAEARSLAYAADNALDHLDVVYSESYEQWFGSANHGRRPAIREDNYRSLQIVSGRMTRIFAPINSTKIDSGSILYISVNETTGLCIDGETLAFQNSDILPTPYNIFSNILFLCPSFFKLPTTTSLLDQYGAGKIILNKARHMSYVVGIPHNPDFKVDNLSLIQLSNSFTSCQSALCCSNLNASQKHRNAENSIKFALDAKYRGELTEGSLCFIFKPADHLLIQPSAALVSNHVLSFLTSIHSEARPLRPRSAFNCDYLSVSESISYSISYSRSVSISFSQSVSYSLSYSVQDGTTATRTIPYTNTETTAYYTYPGSTAQHTYIATTVPYTWTSTDTIYVKRTDEPLPTSLSSTSFPSSPTMSSSTADGHTERGENHEKTNYPNPQMVKPASSQPTSTSQAPTHTLIIPKNACTAMTTIPIRYFPPAKEFRENGLVSGSQLGQLLQHITLA